MIYHIVVVFFFFNEIGAKIINDTSPLLFPYDGFETLYMNVFLC